MATAARCGMSDLKLNFGMQIYLSGKYKDMRIKTREMRKNDWNYFTST